MPNTYCVLVVYLYECFVTKTCVYFARGVCGRRQVAALTGQGTCKTSQKQS